MRVGADSVPDDTSTAAGTPHKSAQTDEGRDGERETGWENPRIAAPGSLAALRSLARSRPMLTRRRVDGHHRRGHSRKHARARRIENRSLTYRQRSSSLKHLANGNEPVCPGRLQKMNRELH